MFGQSLFNLTIKDKTRLLLRDRGSTDFQRMA